MNQESGKGFAEKKGGFKRRRRRRRPEGNGGQRAAEGTAAAVAEGAPESSNSEPLEAHGVLEVLPEGYGFLRT